MSLSERALNAQVVPAGLRLSNKDLSIAIEVLRALASPIFPVEIAQPPPSAKKKSAYLSG